MGNQLKWSGFKPQAQRLYIGLSGRYCLLFFRLFLIVCCLFFTRDISAQESLELTLREAVEIALRENLSLNEETLNAGISRAEIMVKQGEFDPNFKLQSVGSFKKGVAESMITGDEQRILTAEASLGGKAHSGTAYELKWSNKRFRGNSTFLTVNPYYSSELTFSITQPLLKGLGREIQQSHVLAAKHNLEISMLKLYDRADQVIIDTVKAYWDLLSARDELEVAELSLKLANNVLLEVKARIDAGMFAPIEIYKAEAEVALREETLLKNKKLINDAEDALRVRMNLRDWSKGIVPLERPVLPAEGPLPIEIAVNTAMEKRKDLRQAVIEKKNKGLLRKYFENQQLPDLSVIGSAGLNSLSGDYDDTINKLDSGKYYSWQLGLSLSIPLGNRAAKGNAAKARLDEEKADNGLRILEQKIFTEVREAWRSLRLAYETIEATKKTRIATEKRLEAEEGRFRVGMATVNDVLKFQEDYVRALSSEKRAFVTYAKSSVELEKATGTLQ